MYNNNQFYSLKIIIMSENLEFQPMNPDAVGDFSKLDAIREQLRKIKGVAIVGVRQYASNSSGGVADIRMLVGASYLNTKGKDLFNLLRLSPTCTDIDDDKFLAGIDKSDYEKLEAYASNPITLTPPDFEQFKYGRYEGLTDMELYRGWIAVMTSIHSPNEAMSAGQSNAYSQVSEAGDECAGMFRHTEHQDQYYLRGFEISRTQLSPSINPRRPSINPHVLAKEVITNKLGLMKGKYRNLLIREDTTRFQINGDTYSVMITPEVVREVVATNQAKSDRREAKRVAKLAKEIATKE